MDYYMEDIVVKRDNMLFTLLYMACWAMIVVLGLYAGICLLALTQQFSVPALLLAALMIAGIVALFRVKDRFRVELDYTFTNGELDVARVLCNKRREELGCLNVKRAAACGHAAHESFRRYLSMKDVEKKNWFLNQDGNLFYFYEIREGKKYLIVLEPSEEMEDMIRRFLPDGVYQG